MYIKEMRKIQYQIKILQKKKVKIFKEVFELEENLNY